MKIRVAILGFLCLLGFGLLRPSNLFADVKVSRVVWQTVGGGCIPDDKTIQGNWYQTVTSAGRVKYRGNHTNTLRFTCPVSSVNESAGSDVIGLIIYYQDPDGPGDKFQVTGRLMSFSKSNGALSEVCKVTSDKSGQWRSSVAKFDTLDLTRNLYWLEVTIRRKEPSQLTVEFNGAELIETVD